MSSYPEEKDTRQEEQPESELLNQEESTVFSDPLAHEEAKKGSKKLIHACLAIGLLSVVVAVATLIWAFVPKMDDSSSTSSQDEITEKPLWSLDSDKFSTITLKQKNEIIELYSVEAKQESSDEETKRQWLIKDADTSLISSAKTEGMVSAFCLIDYLRTMENPNADYGFDSPEFVVELIGLDAKDSKTLTVGSATADSSARYVKTSDTDKVYLVTAEYFETYSTNLLDFADTTGLPPLSKDSDYNGEYYTNGVLDSFSKLVISGSALSQKLTIEPNRGEINFGLYVITSPQQRYANSDNVDLVFKVFANGLSGDGVYSFKNTAAEQKRFGLAEPDFTATLYADKDSASFKAKLQNDGNYAVVGDGMKVILKVPKDSLSFATLGDASFYSNFLFIESLSEIDTFKIESGNKSNSFSIETEITTNENGSTEKNVSGVKANGKEIDLKNFQDFYEHFLWIPAVEFNFIDTSSRKADTVINITHNDGTKDTVIKYFMISDMRYQMEVNGEEIGVISSSSYNNILRYVENVANGKAYNS